MEQEFVAQSGAANGQHRALEPSEDWQRIDQAYKEIQRRDDRAEHRTWRTERFAWAVLCFALIELGVIVYQWIDHRQVQAFVQVVQVDEQQRVVQLGIPQGLLAYAPPEGLWMDMLGEWVRRVRWCEEDSTHSKTQWAWVYRHTCGQARRLLQAIEDKEQPFKAGKKLVSVELKSITKTPVPESYQILWAETSTDKNLPVVKTTLWAGTFSVGRIQLPTLADAMDNRLGLCVTAFDLSPSVGGMP